MKSTELKKLIKQAVKEAIQEELKDILLEAIKSPKTEIITENKNISTNIPTPSLSSKQNYQDILSDMALQFSTKDVKNFSPKGSMDTTSENGQLPGGELGMDQIIGLMGGGK